MGDLLITSIGYMRLTVEAIGAMIIGVGVLSATFRCALTLMQLKQYSSTEIRLHLGSFLALGLDFQLGANILATAVSPTLEEVQLLAAIVVIRTVLTYFLSKELERKEVAADPE